MTIARKIAFAFAVPLVILIGIAGLVNWSNAHLIATSASRVAHSHEVLAELEVLLSLMKDAETGQARRLSARGRR